MRMLADYVANPAMSLRSVTPLTDRRPRACQEMLERFWPGMMASESALLRFEGIGGRDVYNITAPFTIDGEELLAGRVEDRDHELSDIVFFRREGTAWVPFHQAPQLKGLQDPCVTFIDGELVVGGVRYPVRFRDGRVGWRMEFYRGTSLASLKLMVQGPESMKDIRFCAMPDGKVAVFSRPQGRRGGRGKIGFTVADSLDDITSELIESAPILEGQFAPGEWGGANEAHVLTDGTLGVLGHVARWDSQRARHYYPIAFKLNPKSLRATPAKIIARRSLFPAGPSKRPDLADVVFSGGLLRHADGTATLYAGLSDAAAGTVRMVDPFEAPARVAVV